MRSVNVEDLKDQLGTYLSYVKAGDTVVIEDENLPVAKLTPYVAYQATDEELALAAAGILRLPEFEFDVDELWAMPDAPVRGNAGTQAILDEREEGW